MKPASKRQVSGAAETASLSAAAGVERALLVSLDALVRHKLAEMAAPLDAYPVSTAHKVRRVSKTLGKTVEAHIVLGRVIYSWHRQAPYVDSDGRPKALPLSGPRPSFRSLVVEHEAAIDPAQVLAALKKQGLIRRSRGGLVRPTANVARLSSQSPELVAYVAQTVENLLHTVLGNLQLFPERSPLLERSAVVRDMPEALEREFREFAAEQGELFIENINEWLESRRAGTASSSTGCAGRLTAGVQAFAFVSRAKPSPPPRRAVRGGGSSRHLSSGVRS